MAKQDLTEREWELVIYAIQLVNSGWPRAYVLDHVENKARKLKKQTGICPYCGKGPHIGLFEELTPKVSVGIDLDHQDRVFVEASSNKDGGHFKKRVGWTHCPYCGRELNNGQE